MSISVTRKEDKGLRGATSIFLKWILKKENVGVRTEYVSSVYGPVQRLLNMDINLCFHIILGIS